MASNKKSYAEMIQRIVPKKPLVDIPSWTELVLTTSILSDLKNSLLVEGGIQPRIQVNYDTNTAFVYTPTRVFKGRPQFIGTYFQNHQQLLLGYENPHFTVEQKQDLRKIKSFADSRIAAIPQLKVCRATKRVSLSDYDLFILLKIGAAICDANFLGTIRADASRSACVFVHDLVEQDPRTHSDLLAEF